MVGKVTGAALDFERSQYGRYFEVKPNLSPVELGGSVGGVLDWGSKPDKGLLVRARLTAWSSSHCVVSFQKQDILSAAALVLVQPMKTGNHSNMTEKLLIAT